MIDQFLTFWLFAVALFSITLNGITIVLLIFLKRNLDPQFIVKFADAELRNAVEFLTRQRCEKADRIRGSNRDCDESISFQSTKTTNS